MTDADNIVLLSVDSLRADYCGFSGGADSHTPAMDRLAEDGLVFEQAIAPGPATHDSMPVIFSGEFYPRPDANWSPFENPELIRDHMRARETIPERLARRGYETAAFTTNPWTSRRYGFDDGFDHFEDFMDVDTSAVGPIDRLLERVATNADGEPTSKPLKLALDWKGQNDMFQSWGTFYDDVVDWTERADEPYFLWIFLVDTHMPFLPPDEVNSQSTLATLLANLWLYLGDQRFESVFGERLRAAYADTVRYVDDHVGRLVDDLAGDDPIVVVHGDHGEEFGERGDYGHGQRLSEELIRVPLLVANGPTGRIEQPFSLADLPELLERLADGREPRDVVRPVVRSRNFDPRTAVRGADWKYVETEDERRLYRLSDDREERPMEDAELLTLGTEVVTRWHRDEAERRAIVESATELAALDDV